jgi:hypothetical protein
MKIALDKFARASIEARLGDDVASAVHVALWHYCTRLGGSSWQHPEFPRFLSHQAHQASAGRGEEFELTLDPGIEGILEREARASGGVSPEQLAVHAVFIYLAEADRALHDESDEAPRPLVLL